MVHPELPSWAVHFVQSGGGDFLVLDRGALIFLRDYEFAYFISSGVRSGEEGGSIIRNGEALVVAH
jgi:hypothetical protein